MTRARDFADVISGQFDLPAGALDNVSTDVVNDTTPQLGGNLDLNSNNITGTGNIPSANLTGALPALDGSALQVLKHSHLAHLCYSNRRQHLLAGQSRQPIMTKH